MLLVKNTTIVFVWIFYPQSEMAQSVPPFNIHPCIKSGIYKDQWEMSTNEVEVLSLDRSNNYKIETTTIYFNGWGAGEYGQGQWHLATDSLTFEQHKLHCLLALLLNWSGARHKWVSLSIVSIWESLLIGWFIIYQPMRSMVQVS